MTRASTDGCRFFGAGSAALSATGDLEGSLGVIGLELEVEEAFGVCGAFDGSVAAGSLDARLRLLDCPAFAEAEASVMTATMAVREVLRD